MSHRSLPVLPRHADAEPVIVPDCWYALAESTQLSAKRPLSIERLGRRWVLWRDEQGEARGLPAACPHRGADLGLGRIQGGEIECPYHGFRFTGEGQCTAIPCEGRDARIPAGLHQRAPQLHEAQGLVWMWQGESVPGPIPWPQAAPGPGSSVATWTEQWDVSFTRVMEGMQDLHHFPFAHRKIDPWRGRATRLDPFEFEIDGDRLQTRAGLRRDEAGAEPVASFMVECMFPGVLHLEFGARMDGVVALCPIDEAHTWVWARYRMRTGLGTFVDRLAAWLGLASEFGLVQPDDKRMLASSEPQRASVRDHALVRADAQIAGWHKLRRARLARARERGGPLLEQAPAQPAPRRAS